MKKHNIIIISFSSFLISLFPLYISKINITYTSFCDTEAWFELQKCLISPTESIIVIVFLYFFAFVILSLTFKAFQSKALG